ncbi:flagellar M-ring protein FliF [Alicyclobacillus tolerans]|uniref:flagellar basal-body MS-ring/collar protein FliF n=1 Tax=Alicyclobacillus tolerans TaxID=90970 RepID=UPI001F01E0FF|nr:flagellar basal-body MS-ring/collar protein FliF [Alicyclobacillus tolerans]MCF8568062.1 flagellar M-ring protein FliF [Alicyclobacillus tolerans]
MNENINRIKAMFQNLFRRFLTRYSPLQRRNLLIALISAIACFTVIGWFVFKPRYVVVMSGLDNKSLGQVQAQLQTLKIPNEIQGSSVLVPSSDANTARVQLAMAGLPQTGQIDYSSIQSSFGMTQDQFNLDVLNVLQQSLDQTIESITGVESANVHIVMPQQQLFVSQPEQGAKASVLLQLGTGVQLSPAQVNGIQQLVAHSVTGLSASQVTVVDQNGMALSGNQSVANLAAPTSELQTQNQMQQQLQQELQNGLEQIVGPGNVVVAVHANVTFNQVKTQTHLVQPAQGQQQGLPSSQQQIRQTSNSTGGATGGGPAGQSSTNPGLTTYAGTTGNGGSSSSTDTQSTTNYQNSYTNTTTIGDPIQIQGYTVGIFVNSSDKAITPAVMKQIQNFSNAAVGNQTGPNSNNSVTVSAVPFQASSLATQQRQMSWLPWAVVGAMALALGGAGFAVWRRRKKTQPDEVNPEESADDQGVVLELGAQHDLVSEQITSLAKQDPEQFAKLLRTWLDNGS